MEVVAITKQQSASNATKALKLIGSLTTRCPSCKQLCSAYPNNGRNALSVTSAVCACSAVNTSGDDFLSTVVSDWEFLGLSSDR